MGNISPKPQPIPVPVKRVRLEPPRGVKLYIAPDPKAHSWSISKIPSASHFNILGNCAQMCSASA